jgi:hypothetical protein
MLSDHHHCHVLPLVSFCWVVETRASPADHQLLSLGMSSVQYATEVVPKTMGYVAIIVAGDGLVNSILILTFIWLAKTNDHMSCGFMVSSQPSFLVFYTFDIPFEQH